MTMYDANEKLVILEIIIVRKTLNVKEIKRLNENILFSMNFQLD